MEWIDVNDKLPEDLVEYKDRKAISVLVSTSKGTVHSCNRDRIYGYSKNDYYWAWGRIKNVVAWMKLPEPYKK